jgi:hypothetical protein
MTILTYRQTSLAECLYKVRIRFVAYAAGIPDVRQHQASTSREESNIVHFIDGNGANRRQRR